MNIEQACRFRTESGYCICAKSAGITLDQEIAIGNLFNDSMNSLFSKMGQKILTCAVDQTEVLIAQSTMRSDIKSRKSIFTNAYVLSLSDYECSLRENPSALLLFDLNKMLDLQPASSEMEPPELDFCHSDQAVLDELLKKYQLDGPRYAQLLFQAYRAVTENKTLCLSTQKPLEETARLVQELVYCIAQGLLPLLRGQLSYSSALDSRMTVCVASAEDRMPPPASALSFAADPPLPADLNRMDDMTAAVFLHLAESSPAVRAALLTAMEGWLSALTASARRASFELIVASYYLSGQKAYTGAEAVRLSVILLGSAKLRGTDQSFLDHAMVTLLEPLTGEGLCPPNLLAALAERYLKDGGTSYCAAAEQLLSMAPGRDRLDLVARLLPLPQTERQAHLIVLLLQQLSWSCDEMPADLAQQLVLWTIANDSTALMGPCTELVLSYDAGQRAEFICSLLDQADGRRLRACEDRLLGSLLGAFRQGTHPAGDCLSPRCCDLLDRHFEEGSPRLAEACLSYFFLVRLHQCQHIDGQLALMGQLETTCPGFWARITAQLQSGQVGYADLWEQYQTMRCLKNCESYSDLTQVCATCNQFEASDGPFEQAAAHLWTELLVSALEACTQLSALVQATESSLQSLKRVRLSPKTMAHITQESIGAFWAHVTYPMLTCSAESVPPPLCAGKDSDGEKKRAVLAWRNKMLQNPNDASGFCRLILESGDDISSELSLLKDGFYALAKLVLRKTGVLSWDLLLLYCLDFSKRNAPRYDCKKLAELVTYMEKDAPFPEGLKASGANSCILPGDEQLCRDLCRAATHSAPRLLQELADELRPHGTATGWAPWGQKRRPEEAPVREDHAIPKAVKTGGFSSLFGRKKATPADQGDSWGEIPKMPKEPDVAPRSAPKGGGKRLDKRGGHSR